MRGPAVLDLLVELFGLTLIGLMLFFAWPPAVLGFLGLLLVGAVEMRGRR